MAVEAVGRERQGGAQTLSESGWVASKYTVVVLWVHAVFFLNLTRKSVRYATPMKG